MTKAAVASMKAIKPREGHIININRYMLVHHIGFGSGDTE